MSWWRKKADDNLGEDNILDLDNVVWRGINQSDRLNRLAEAARQADGELPEPGEKIYPPKKPVLPTVPLPISNIEESEDDGDVRVDNVIETEIRQQVIAEAMDAVLAFQEGRPQKEIDDDPIDTAEIEAAIEEIADQTLAEAQRTPSPSPEVFKTNSQETDLGQAPDMSDAIRNVVADEIGSWLKDHMPRIMAETIAQSELAKTELAEVENNNSTQMTPKASVERKTKPKVKAKTPKRAVKASKKKASKKATKSRK